MKPSPPKKWIVVSSSDTKHSRLHLQKKWMVLGFLFLVALFNIIISDDGFSEADDDDRTGQGEVLSEEAVLALSKPVEPILEDAGDSSLHFTDWMPTWKRNLQPIKQKPQDSDTILFWHLPKCGGTTAKNLYICMEKTITTRVGVLPQFGHQNTKELIVFQPYPSQKWKTVNVDTTTITGIKRAMKMKLVQSHTADLIFSMEMGTAVKYLFDNRDKGRNKARVIAMFRHPVTRLVSKFYYLQVADWETTYHPEWAKITLLQWARTNRKSSDDNIMVRKLTGKDWKDEVGETDLRVAKKILRDHVVVGLLDQPEESFRRFNMVMGIDESIEPHRGCMDQFFGIKVAKDSTNSNKHPPVSKMF